MKKFEFKNKEKKKGYLYMILSFAMLVVLFVGIYKFESIWKEQNLLLTKQAVHKAVIQCYANEGFYPRNLSYLEENYNLNIDYSNYYIYYESVAFNLMPEFAVFSR